MKITKNIAAVIGTLCIIASIVGDALDYSNNHAFLMFGVVLLVALFMPLHIITTKNYDVIRDEVIKAAEKQQGYQNVTA